MTTMTPEAATHALPRATMNTTWGDGLNAGDQHPYLAVADAPAGYAGCLIMPPEHEAGWLINHLSHEAVRPFAGMKGLWVTPSQITVDESTVDEVTVPTTNGTIDLTAVPAEHRAAVPDNAQWCTVTDGIDGGRQVRDVGRFLCIPIPDGSGRSHTSAPILLAWPGHPLHSLFGNRPGAPEGWRGWYAHGHAEIEEAPAPVLEAVPVGARIRVIGEGRLAPVGTLGTVTDSHDDLSLNANMDDGRRGLAFSREDVEVIEGVAEAHPADWYVPGQLVEVQSNHPSTNWQGQAVVVSIAEPQYVVVTSVAHPEFGNGTFQATEYIRPVERPFVVGDRVVLAEPHVTAPGGHQYNEAPSGIGSFGVLDTVSAGRDGCFGIQWEGTTRHSTIHGCCIRLAGPAPEPSPPQVGEWFSWGSHGQWFRCSGVDGNFIRTDRVATRDTAVRDSVQGPFSFDVMRDYLVVNAESGDAIPEFLRGEFAQPEFPAGHWFTYDNANYWYHVTRVEDGRVHFDQRLNKTGRHTLTACNSNRRLSLLTSGEHTGVMVVGPESDDLPDYVRAWYVEHGVVNETAPTPEGEETVESLRARLAEVQAAYDADMAAIANVMQGEAEDRGWCDEYEEVVGRINEHTTATFAGERTRQWDVDYTTTVQVQVTGRVRVEVPRSATGHDIQEAARTLLREQGFEQSGRLGTPAWGEVDPDIARIIDYNAR